MSDLNLHTITNHFQDAKLASLRSWQKASEITRRDQGGPYVVLQEGYDPDDMQMNPNEFILGRSGKWLVLGRFYKLNVAERREEFVFGTAGEVMQMMGELPPKVVMFGRAAKEEEGAPVPESDEMAAAIKVGKAAGGGAAPAKPS
jgi:hypothetical protein